MKNVLFITADQWRADCLSSMNHPCVKTPNLDKLAQDGVLFRNHYAQAAPCGPARASLYTGMYLQNHRIVRNGTPLDARHSNFALEARKGGYDPLLFGYTDVSPDPRTRAPGDPDLKKYEGVLPGLTPAVLLDSEALPWLTYLKGKGYETPLGPWEIHRPVANYPNSANRGPTFAPPHYKAEDSLTAFLTDEVLKYLSIKQNRPWFIYLSYLRPHPPFIAPEPYNTMYDPQDIPIPVKAENAQIESQDHPWLSHYINNQKQKLWYGQVAKNNVKLDGYDIRQIRATYYGLISEVDHQIGRLIEFLKENDFYDNTLIIFTTDHGEQLGDHWLFGKSGYFDQSFHIPLIIRDPELDAQYGQVVDDFTESIDVLPTILDWINLDIPTQCDGWSLLSYSKGLKPDVVRKEAHWGYDFRDIEEQRVQQELGLRMDQCTLNVIRDKKFKYVHFTALPPLLFDLENDPNELNNCAEDPAYVSIAMKYSQALLSWRMQNDERTLTNTTVSANGILERKDPIPSHRLSNS
ncbi:MAG: alkaline phosphatase family protein [Nitrosomonadaceae bacterium]